MLEFIPWNCVLIKETNSPIVNYSYWITVPQHGKCFHADIQSHLYDATNRPLVWMPAVPGAYAAGVPIKFLGSHQWASGMLNFKYTSLIPYSCSWNFGGKLWVKFHNSRICGCLEKWNWILQIKLCKKYSLEPPLNKCVILDIFRTHSG